MTSSCWRHPQDCYCRGWASPHRLGASFRGSLQNWGFPCLYLGTGNTTATSQRTETQRDLTVGGNSGQRTLIQPPRDLVSHSGSTSLVRGYVGINQSTWRGHQRLDSLYKREKARWQGSWSTFSMTKSWRDYRKKTRGEMIDIYKIMCAVQKVDKRLSFSFSHKLKLGSTLWNS